MLCPIVRAALITMAVACDSAIFAEPPSYDGPPPWRDNASVYLTPNRLERPVATELDTPAPPVSNEVTPTAPLNDFRELAQALPSKRLASDPTVRQAFHQIEPTRENHSERQLRPPSADVQANSNESSSSTALRRLPSLAPQWESLGTTVLALGVVLGFFLVCAWLLRRGTRKTSVGLPREVVSVLGRVPLAARNVAQLLRVGNKLVLISLTPAGAETLTEVTDPSEVDRLVGLCYQSDPRSTTKAFEQVFRQMSIEPVQDDFLGNGSLFPRGDTTRG
jgi:flagellar biogenesis protein FliO